MDKLPDIVDLVLYLLTGLSVMTWTILLMKSYAFWQLSKLNQNFKQHYGQVMHLSQLPSLVSASQVGLSLLTSKALASIKAMSREANIDAHICKEQLLQVLREERHAIIVKLEAGLAVLASVGSTAPFIGLFGTVWGIMHALKGISATGSAGLDVVAGPIGEALIATAMGITAAIPAVLAYNFLLRRVKLAAAEMELFSERIQTLAARANYKVD